jgi:hypothetical protein
VDRQLQLDVLFAVAFHHQHLVELGMVYELSSGFLLLGFRWSHLPIYFI